VAGAIGECVHIAGVLNFLKLAEQAGWRTVFLGPATPVEEFIHVASREKADLVGVSYRLTAATGERLLGEFAESADELRSKGIRFVFGGTPEIANRAIGLGFFERVFDGSQPAEAVLAFLKGQRYEEGSESDYPQALFKRIAWKSPFPVLRHHFGLPTLEATQDGISRIADAKAVDVISLGIDQDAQANFFRPERQKARARGAGGVPVRTADDYRALYRSSRRGNFPLMRTYSGTDDFIPLAEMYIETINIAWCAIPIFWFNQMDGRGVLGLEDSIREHQKVMAWYGEKNVPVELNEPHHWGMRDAPDVIYVATAYLSAYNARAFGVQDYIAQMMFNSPADTSDVMDLAKMQACLKLIEPLASQDFRIWRQTRTGLLSYPLNPIEARAHLAASVYLQMALKPHIVHVVGHTEAHHAATADDVIEASRIARRVIENSLKGAPDMNSDPRIQNRVDELIGGAMYTLDAIRNLAPSEVNDPLTHPATLTQAVTKGILDAPHLKNNPFGCGKIRTEIDGRGACGTINQRTGAPISEKDRLAKLDI
jgi:methylmalonyl-CoA mutase cobalamin-binding subunit